MRTPSNSRALEIASSAAAVYMQLSIDREITFLSGAAALICRERTKDLYIFVSRHTRYPPPKRSPPDNSSSVENIRVKCLACDGIFYCIFLFSFSLFIFFFLYVSSISKCKNYTIHAQSDVRKFVFRRWKAGLFLKGSNTRKQRPDIIFIFIFYFIMSGLSSWEYECECSKLSYVRVSS